jgi:hypothetical protein
VLHEAERELVAFFDGSYGSARRGRVMSTLLQKNEAPGRDVTRAGGSYWHKAVYSNVINNDFTLGPQAS